MMPYVDRWLSFNTQPPEGGWMSHIFRLVLFPLFQHTAARRRLGWLEYQSKHFEQFQHTAARRRLGLNQTPYRLERLFQHTAARRRLAG